MSEAACERCGKPLEQLRRGRPRRWCGQACRKGAQRDRDRGAALERRQAAEAATARAEAARAWRALEAFTAESSELAATVLRAAAGDDRAALDAALGELRAGAADLARLAESYFSATQRAQGTRGTRSEHLRKYVFTHASSWRRIVL